MGSGCERMWGHRPGHRPEGPDLRSSIRARDRGQTFVFGFAPLPRESTACERWDRSPFPDGSPSFSASLLPDGEPKTKDLAPGIMTLGADGRVAAVVVVG